MAEEDTKQPDQVVDNKSAGPEKPTAAVTRPVPTRGRRPHGPRRQDAAHRGGMAEEKQFEERVVHIDRVARVVKGGRRFRFRALVVVGDKKGRVGVASAKGADVTAAVSKAVEVAKKKLVSIHIYNGTVPHEVTAKVGGAQILIKPASPGTGLIAGGTVRTVLEVAGITNVLSKSLGSANKTNIAYATVAGLLSMEPAEKWVTRQTKSAVESSKKKVASKTTKSPKTAKEKKK